MISPEARRSRLRRTATTPAAARSTSPRRRANSSPRLSPPRPATSTDDARLGSPGRRTWSATASAIAASSGQGFRPRRRAHRGHRRLRRCHGGSRRQRPLGLGAGQGGPRLVVSRYRVEVSPAALRAVRKLDPKLRPRIEGAIALLAEDPRPPASRPLKGRPGYRVRVGDYRIIYTIQDDVLVIVVVTLGHRRDVYR